MAGLTAEEIRPDGLYRCCVSFMSGPQAAVANEGEILRGRDARVLSAPQYFVEKDAPQSEWPTVWDQVVRQNDERARQEEAARKAEFERRAKSNVVKPVQPKYVTAKKTFTADIGGEPATIEKGGQWPESHPVVVENRSLFS